MPFFFILYFLTFCCILLWYFLSCLSMILKCFTCILHYPWILGQSLLYNSKLSDNTNEWHISEWFSQQEEKYYHQNELKSVWEYGDWKHTCKMQICNPAWDVTKMNADVNLKSPRQVFMVIVNNEWIRSCEPKTVQKAKMSLSPESSVTNIGKVLSFRMNRTKRN